MGKKISFNRLITCNGCHTQVVLKIDDLYIELDNTGRQHIQSTCAKCGEAMLINNVPHDVRGYLMRA